MFDSYHFRNSKPWARARRITIRMSSPRVMGEGRFQPTLKAMAGQSKEAARPLLSGCTAALISGNPRVQIANPDLLCASCETIRATPLHPVRSGGPYGWPDDEFRHHS